MEKVVVPRPFLEKKAPPRESQIEPKLEKRVPKFEVVFDRVPKLILELFGVENDTKKRTEFVKIRAKGPKHRIFAHVLDIPRLPVKSRVRAVRKSMKTQKNQLKNMKKQRSEKEGLPRPFFLIDFGRF